MSRRKLKYGSQDWFDTIYSEIRVPQEPLFPREQMNVNVMYPQMAPCPPGYRYRPKRKPGQRKCTKETVKSVLSFLQMLATQNRISIFKPRKDKKGYTRTLLTIPQLKSRLTRHGISYKTSNFGVLPMGGGKGPEEPEDPRIAAYAIEKKRKIAEQNRKWRAAKAAETAEKYEAIREAGMDRAAADAIRYMGMTPREKATEQAKQRRKLAKQAKEYMAAQALLASASGAGSSSSGAGPSSAGLDFTIPDVDFGRTRYNYNYNYGYSYPRNYYGTQEMWQ